ncbi:MAG: murein biosynthesis integral membrane protein MurJ [Simkaniaceae bacterium]|nr:murein biosynthesis integral membrane protein MurJ [Simkaniaceae bacterium]
MQEISERSVTSSALRFLTGSFVSRFTGMIRDMTMAFYFGTSPSIAAFFVAYRLANLMRRLFGEGALLNGFIPHFESLKKEDPQNAHKFYRDLVWTFTLVLFATVACVELALYFLPNGEIIKLTALMFPGLIFICLYALSSALLHCYGRFFLSSLAPVAFNLVWIFTIFFSHRLPHDQAVRNLSISIVCAFALQWLSTLAASRSLSKTVSQRIHLFSPEIKKMVLPLLLGVIGVGATQINSALDVIFARIASLEGPAYLSYSMRLIQLPIALFAVSVATALLPKLSREKGRGFKDELEKALYYSGSILILGTFAIACLGASSVNLIYGRGDFSQTSCIYTTICLWAYGIGLLPMGLSILLAPAFYARKDFKTPTIISLISIGFNITLNSLFIFVFNLGATSIALTTTLAATLSSYLLIRSLRKEIGTFFRLSKFAKITCSSAFACLLTLCFGAVFLNDPTLNLSHFSRALPVQALSFTSQLALYSLISLGWVGKKILLMYNSRHEKSDP